MGATGTVVVVAGAIVVVVSGTVVVVDVSQLSKVGDMQ